MTVSKPHLGANDPARRHVLAGGAALMFSTLGASVLPTVAAAKTESKMTPKAFVYTEVQISAPFDQVPWDRVNKAIQQQPGFLNKTWFSGVGNGSVGGFYSFDSIENAQKFVTDYSPSEAAGFGTGHTTRVFDASKTQEASLDMGAPHYGAAAHAKPGAYVYTEVQVNVPFENAPWRDRNPVLRAQKGLLSKVWLSGLHTNTLGGIDAFDTIENAKAFAVDTFPETGRALNASVYTRIFDASIVETASRAMNSPFYS